MTMHHTTAPAPTPEGPKKESPFEKGMRYGKKPVVFLPVIALLLGIGIGSGNAPEPVTVTKEVPGPERIVEKEVEVQVPVTPEACTTYIDLSEQAFSYTSEAMGYMRDAMEGVSVMDVSVVEKATADLQVVQPKIEALSSEVLDAKAACREAANQ